MEHSKQPEYHVSCEHSGIREDFMSQVRGTLAQCGMPVNAYRVKPLKKGTEYSFDVETQFPQLTKTLLEKILGARVKAITALTSREPISQSA